MKKLYVVFTVAMLLLMGCNGAENVATVNGESISKQELDKRVQKMMVVYEAQGSSVDREQLEKKVLDSLVLEKVIAQTAKEKGIVIPIENAEKQLEEVKKNFVSMEEWQALLDSRHLTEEDMVKYYHDKMVAEGLAEKLGGQEQYDELIKQKKAQAKVEMK